MSDPETGTSPSEAITSEDVARQIRAITHPLTQQLAHLCKLLKELRDEQAHRRHKETTSSRAASNFTRSTSQSDTHNHKLLNFLWKKMFNSNVEGLNFENCIIKKSTFKKVQDQFEMRAHLWLQQNWRTMFIKNFWKTYYVTPSKFH